MFDCGPSATHKLTKVGLFPNQIDCLFFTHHHYDHNADYGCFLLTRWNHQASNNKELLVWGPRRTEWITDRLIGSDGAFSDDWRARTRHPASLAEYRDVFGGIGERQMPSVTVRDIEPGSLIERNGWSVTAGKAKHHEPYLHSLAYRVEWEEKVIVFSGDTLPCQSVEELAQGDDTLVVTCANHQEVQDSGPSSIFGTLDAARLARDAGVKRLVLAHTFPPLERLGSKERAISDVARIFEGEIIFGEELMILDLK
jgi:ribonuclease BN (tRNA processing enzyme)